MNGAAGAPAVGANGRAATIAPWIVGAAFATPVIVARYPPMGDLAFHEAMVATLRHFGDPSFAPPGLYTLNLGQPNQLFHVVAAGLAFVMPTDVACKLVVAATVLAIVVLASRLAAHVGASRWAALIVAPLALGWTFQWGLVANLTGLALLLASFPALDRLTEGPTWRRAVLASAWGVAIHFAHESTAVVYAGAALFFTLARPLSLRESALRLSPLVAIAALVGRYVIVSERLKAPSIRAVPTSFVGLDVKLTQLPGALFGGYDVMTTTVLLALAVGATVAFVVPPRGAAPPPASSESSTRDTIHRHRFFLLGVCCFVAYLAMPLALNGSTLVYHRFLAPAYALVVLGAAARPFARVRSRSSQRARFRSRRSRRWCLASSNRIAVTAISIRSSRTSSARARWRSSTCRRVHRASSRRSPAQRRARSRSAAGVFSFSFTDAPAAPIATAPEYQWNEPVLRLTYRPLAFMPAHDLQRFRYVLVRQTDAQSVGLVVAAMQPEAKLVARAGEWMLFESTLSVVPLTSPDVALPSPAPQTLQARIVRILKEQRRDDD